MSADPNRGDCPRCGRAIEPVHELGTYERSDGSLGVFSECPACPRIVEPE